MIFAEVLDRRGEVVHRVRLDRFPFRIGRGYANDLVLDDPHVCPEHAIVEELPDGGLRLRDLASRNGLWLPGGGRVGEVALGDEVNVRVGRTQLRLRDRAFAVAPALPVSRRHAALEWLFGHWSAVLVLLAALYAASLGQTWRNTWRETEWSDLVMLPLFESVAATTLWAGGWALVTRFLIQRPRFPAHFAVAALASLASRAIDEALEWARFFVSGIDGIRWTDVVLAAALAGLLLLAHLSIAKVARPRLRALVAGAAAGLWFGVAALELVRSEPDWVSVLPYWSRLEPVPVAWLPRSDLGEFLAGTSWLESELAALAAQESDAGGVDRAE